jgi:hypothetical protein
MRGWSRTAKNSLSFNAASISGSPVSEEAGSSHTATRATRPSARQTSPPNRRNTPRKLAPACFNSNETLPAAGSTA